MNKLIVVIILTFLATSIEVAAQVYGCTDSAANNFNGLATINDGSCTYNAVNIVPVSSQNLSDTLIETSGLIIWNNRLLTHNDNTELNLYSLDTISGAIQSIYLLANVTNIDWEDIDQDSNYVYVGDFGNNANGNRTNLKILRIEKASLLINAPVIDTIFFSYSDQVNFTPTGGNNTDFDCEAFIVSNDSIYLFTKQWVSNETGLYSLPKTPGTHIANLKSTLNVQGLITGATFLEDKHLIVLCGYSNVLQPFLYCLYDFSNFEFFSGNKRKIGLSLPFHQVEGIATNSGRKYYLSNEYFTQPPLITIPQKMHIIDLDSYLSPYFNTLSSLPQANIIVDGPEVFPNPVNGTIQVQLPANVSDANYELIDASGKVVSSGKLVAGFNSIDAANINSGNYFIRINNNNYQVVISH